LVEGINPGRRVVLARTSWFLKQGEAPTTVADAVPANGCFIKSWTIVIFNVKKPPGQVIWLVEGIKEGR
jgi:hypothetical protein